MTLPMTQRPTGMLPVEVTGFVGRQTELAELTALLAAARLVTVLGPGGVGKTRIALRVAQGMADQFADGVCLTELSGLGDPELLPHTVAGALGLTEQDARLRLDAIVEFVRDRSLLLIFDTCEHVVDACAMLADLLLRESAGVKILATSRQPLDVPGEHAYSIAPLPVPDPDEPEDGRADEADEGAVELFRQRAAAVVPGFAVTAANRRDVVRLCRSLDGIPLAIELATVRLRAVPLEELADRLDDRFRVTGERRTAYPRHQTLRNALGWSHELCTEQERLLWRRLSVFAEEFDVSAAEEVCAGGGLDEGDVLEALIGLVDKSVVLRVDGPQTQYRQLDTIREFGADELRAAGEQDQYRSRYIGRYLDMAREFNDRLIDDDQLLRFRALEAEHANLRIALEYALVLPGQERTAARICTWLWGYWQIARMTEARYWLGKVLQRLSEPTSEGADRTAERAWCLAIRGYTAANQGDAVTAVADLGQAAQLAAGLGDHLLAGRIGLYQNIAFALLGQPEEAARHGQAAAEQMTAADDLVGLIHLDIVTGYQHFLSGEPDRARACGAQALAHLGTESQERWLSSYAHFLMAAGLFASGAHDESARECGIALRLKTDLDDMLGIAYCLEVFAWLAAAQGRPARTAWLLGAADALWQRIGTRLSGAAAAEAVHADAERRAVGTLGEERYRALLTLGASRPLDVIVDHACDGLEELRPTAPGPARESLTPREREVAALVAKGLSNREIAERLTISKRTVDAHVDHIFAKLKVTSRVLVAARLRAETEQAG